MAKFMRNGQSVWPYCNECGCRLDIKVPAWAESDAVLTHFGIDPEKDARGCKCKLLNAMEIIPFEKVEQFIDA